MHNTTNELIQKRRLRWLGHLKRMKSNIPKMIMEWNADCRRKKGSLKNSERMEEVRKILFSKET